MLLPELTTLISRPTASPLARLCRGERGIWLCAHPPLSPPAEGHQCACACRGKAWPHPRLPGTRAHGFPGGVCPVLLEVSWCSELAPDSAWTGTSSGPTPCPRSGMRAVGHGGVTGRPVSAPCLRALREGKGVNSLNYVFLRKEFCSERQAGQMCKFCASRGKTTREGGLVDALKPASDALGVSVQSQLGQSGTSLTFH